MGESSDVNCCIFTLSSISWGDRYTFPIVNVRQMSPPLMSINRHSHVFESLYQFRILWLQFTFRNITKPPCLVHLLPWWISWYPGNCNNDKLESLEVHVSCRQIAPKCRPWNARLSITGNIQLNFAVTLSIFNVRIENSYGLFWNTITPKPVSYDECATVKIYCRIKFLAIQLEAKWTTKID